MKEGEKSLMRKLKIKYKNCWRVQAGKVEAKAQRESLKTFNIRQSVNELMKMVSVLSIVRGTEITTDCGVGENYRESMSHFPN